MNELTRQTHDEFDEIVFEALVEVCGPECGSATLDQIVDEIVWRDASAKCEGRDHVIDALWRLLGKKWAFGNHVNNQLTYVVGFRDD